MATEILTRMCEGESLHKICQAPHLPSDNTVRGRADSGRHPGFTEAFERAQQLKLGDGSQSPSSWLMNRKRLRQSLRSAPISFAFARDNGLLNGCCLASSDHVLSIVTAAAPRVQVVLPSNGRLGDDARVIEGSHELVERATDQVADES